MSAFPRPAPNREPARRRLGRSLPRCGVIYCVGRKLSRPRARDEGRRRRARSAVLTPKIPSRSRATRSCPTEPRSPYPAADEEPPSRGRARREAIGTGGSEHPGRARALVPRHSATGSGVDLTRRELQTIAKDKGWPGRWARPSTRGAPMAALTPGGAGGPRRAGDHARRERGRPAAIDHRAHRTWSVAEIVGNLSTH